MTMLCMYFDMMRFSLRNTFWITLRNRSKVLFCAYFHVFCTYNLS
jgi:hypothetical protein